MELGPTVGSSEDLARYLAHRSYFTSDRVKPVAFEPDKHLRLSVFRISALAVDEVFSIGEQNMVKPPYGFASIVASLVYEEGLLIEADNIPPRHAEIIGWPIDEAHQKSIAQVLAAQASLVCSTK